MVKRTRTATLSLSRPFFRGAGAPTDISASSYDNPAVAVSSTHAA